MNMKIFQNIRNRKKKISFFLGVANTLILAMPFVAFGEAPTSYIHLVPLPGVTAGIIENVPAFLNQLVGITIGAGSILAVIMIGVGGIEYMASDAVFSKDEARKRMSDAVIGLLILLGSYVLLYTINPDIVNLNIFRNAEQLDPLNLSAPSPGGAIQPRPYQATPEGHCLYGGAYYAGKCIDKSLIPNL